MFPQVVIKGSEYSRRKRETEWEIGHLDDDGHGILQMTATKQSKHLGHTMLASCFGFHVLLQLTSILLLLASSEHLSWLGHASNSMLNNVHLSVDRGGNWVIVSPKISQELKLLQTKKVQESIELIEYREAMIFNFFMEV